MWSLSMWCFTSASRKGGAACSSPTFSKWVGVTLKHGALNFGVIAANCVLPAAPLPQGGQVCLSGRYAHVTCTAQGMDLGACMRSCRLCLASAELLNQLFTCHVQALCAAAEESGMNVFELIGVLGLQITPSQTFVAPQVGAAWNKCARPLPC